MGTHHFRDYKGLPFDFHLCITKISKSSFLNSLDLALWASAFTTYDLYILDCKVIRRYDQIEKCYCLWYISYMLHCLLITESAQSIYLNCSPWLSAVEVTTPFK